MSNEISTERLVLRPAVNADGGAMVQALNDLSVSRWLSRVPHPFTAKDLKILNEDGSTRWPHLMAISLDAEFVGCIGTEHHLGYWIAPEFWGKGFAKEATMAAVDYLFQNQDRTELQSGYFVGNAASAKILNILGFVEIGRSHVPCRALGVDQENIDVVLTRDAWEARK